MKEAILGNTTMRYHERMVMLSVLDGLWKDHLLSMDHLKEGIGLRGYGQQDPLVAYKKESFDMFEAMMGRFQEDTVRFLFLMQIVGPDGQPITQLPPRRAPEISSEFVPPVSSPVGVPGHVRRQWCSSHSCCNAGAAAVRTCPGPGTRALDDDRCPGAGVSTQEEARTRTSPDGWRQWEFRCARAAPSRREGGAERSLSLRLRQEIQEVPRRRRLGRAAKPQVPPLRFAPVGMTILCSKPLSVTPQNCHPDRSEPGFVLRGTQRRPRVRLSVRKAA